MAALGAAQGFLVALVLLTGGASKLRGAFGKGEPLRTALGVLIKSDVRAMRAWRAIAMTELVVGFGLLAWPSVRTPSAAAAALMVGATVYLAWAMHNAPDRPCGCFGGGREGQVSAARLGRAGGLALLSALAVAAGESWVEALSRGWPLALLSVEAGLLVWLSPEARDAWVRLRPPRLPGCLSKDVPLETTLRALKQSPLWVRLRSYLTSEELLDHWRSGCWRFVSYPATVDETDAAAVFAIRVPSAKTPIRAAFVDETTGRILVQTSDSSGR
jgi:hypothetical protein